MQSHIVADKFGMKKYFIVARNTWEEAVTYRVSFAIWRVRSVLEVLTLFFLWTGVLGNQTAIFNYSRSQILTYVFGMTVITALVFSSQTSKIGDDINNGNLSNYLLRPVKYLRYYFAKDIADKTMNVFFACIEFIILYFLLKPPIFLQTNIVNLVLFLVAIIIGILLFYFISVVISFYGFWSNEVWGPRFLFITLLGFFSGGLFPLDILPRAVYGIFELLPFMYLVYFPLKVYLGHISYIFIFKGFLIGIFWVFIIYGLTRYIWQKGIKEYTAQGR